MEKFIKPWIAEVLRQAQSPIIIELGACQGEEHSEFEALLGPGQSWKHIMVEPDPENCRIARSHMTLSADVQLIERAIVGPALDGQQVLFHRAVHRVDGTRYCGSLLEPGGQHEFCPEIEFFETVSVPATTLDSLYFSGLHDWQSLAPRPIDLLWVDIQGGERGMISGGSRALAATRFMLIEAEREEYYGGQALRPEILQMLPNWKVRAEFEHDLLLQNPDRMPL